MQNEIEIKTTDIEGPGFTLSVISTMPDETWMGLRACHGYVTIINPDRTSMISTMTIQVDYAIDVNDGVPQLISGGFILAAFPCRDEELDIHGEGPLRNFIEGEIPDAAMILSVSENAFHAEELKRLDIAQGFHGCVIALKRMENLRGHPALEQLRKAGVLSQNPAIREMICDVIETLVAREFPLKLTAGAPAIVEHIEP